MHKKVAVICVLIVLLPVGLVGWLALRMAHNEQQVAAAQVQALVAAQLGSVDDGINTYFQALQDTWLARLRQPGLSDEAIKNLPTEFSLVQQVLVIGADGKRVLPAPTSNPSPAEQQFLQRTSAIWDNPSLLTQGATLPQPSVNTSFVSTRYASSVAGDVANTDASAAQWGWYTWHWNAELHHLFWMRDAQSRLIGLELSPVALVSEIIGRLPSTSADDAEQTQANVQLINGNGQSVYEWGNYRPGEGEKYLAMLPLSHPLGTWKLTYFGPALAGTNAANSLVLFAALLAMGAALAGLAFYLYREHGREVRVAAQRVNFVNQVSHELKTPLTNIRLYAELLESEIGDAPEDATMDDRAKLHKYIGVITAESQRLSRLIANVLSFGQFQKSQFKLSLQPGEVDEVVLRCIAAFKPALDAKSVVVQFSGHARALVLVDAQALEQILNNLFSNAEKYAASGGSIDISTQQTNGTTTIDVRDYGPGVPAGERERIFQPFYRVSSRLTDGVAGTGIGLDIARQLARQHGGDVTLVDTATGACFRVTLGTALAEGAP